MPVLPIIGIILTVASTVMSIVMKPKKRAPDAAAPVEGYKIVTDGQSAYLPIVYGRALVGGIRVRTHVSNMMMTQPGIPSIITNINASKSFHSILSINKGGAYTVDEYNDVGVIAPRSLRWGYPIGGLMLDNWLDLKNYNFLFVQQALCVGPVHRVADVSIDDGGGARDAKYGTLKEKLDGFGRFEPNAGLMIDVYYGYGKAWNFESNFPGINAKSSSATFDGMAFAAASFRLSDSPQFSGTPNLQFFVEGRLVSKVIAGVLHSTKVYTNNPAWCLLDYLLDNGSGKGIHPEDIDLVSFEEVAAICDTVVQVDALIQGRMNQPFDTDSPGSIVRYKRDIPLYECNITIDTGRPIRDNIEAILGTMGDARLVWSSGIYKLKLQYPVDLPGPVTSTIITDDDIVLGEPLSLVWPTSSERLNCCTVKFMDEDLDYKENSISWPDKYSSSSFRSVGGITFPAGVMTEAMRASMSSEAAVFLDAYGISGRTDPTKGDFYDVSIWFPPNSTEEIVVLYTSTNPYVFSLRVHKGAGNLVNFTTTGWQPYGNILSARFHVKDSDKAIAITLTFATGSPSPLCVSGFTVTQGSAVLATSRGRLSNQLVSDSKDSAIYNAFLEEDGGLQLETEVTADGTVDRYHALAIAEEMVRTSRSTVHLTLTYTPYEFILEPADYFVLTSETLGVTGMVFKVNTAKVSPVGDIEIDAERFHPSMLAWSTKSTDHLPSVFDTHAYSAIYRALEYLTCSNGVLSGKYSTHWGRGCSGFIGISYDLDKSSPFNYLCEIPLTDTWSVPITATGYFRLMVSFTGPYEEIYKYYIGPGEGGLPAGGVTQPPIPVGFKMTVSGTTVSWGAFTVTPSGSYPGGSAEWVSGILYIYVLEGSVLTTTSHTTASAGVILGSYSPTNGEGYSKLLPPETITGKLGTDISWTQVTEAIKYSVRIFRGGSVVRTIVTGDLKTSYTPAQIVEDFSTKPSSITVSVSSIDSLGRISQPKEATIVTQTLPIPSSISVTQTGETVSVTFVTTAPSVVISAGASGFDPEGSSVYNGLATSPVTFNLQSTVSRYLRLAAKDGYDGGLLWSTEIALQSTQHTPIIVPVNSHTVGVTPYEVTTFMLQAGIYSHISARLGCEKSTVSAILTLEAESAVLATCINVGVPSLIKLPSISLLEDTLVTVKIRSSTPYEYAFLLGLVIQ